MYINAEGDVRFQNVYQRLPATGDRAGHSLVWKGSVTRAPRRSPSTPRCQEAQPSRRTPGHAHQADGAGQGDGTDQADGADHGPGPKAQVELTICLTTRGPITESRKRSRHDRHSGRPIAVPLPRHMADSRSASRRRAGSFAVSVAGVRWCRECIVVGTNVAKLLRKNYG